MESVIPDNFYRIKVADTELGIDLMHYITDRVLEVARTNKQIESLNKQILGLENQLANQKFIENAELEIIEEKQASLSLRKLELTDQLNKLEILNG
jgi:valyl-tRNA synthetase